MRKKIRWNLEVKKKLDDLQKLLISEEKLNTCELAVKVKQSNFRIINTNCGFDNTSRGRRVLSTASLVAVD